MTRFRLIRRVAVWRGGALLVVSAQLFAFSAAAQSKPVATQPVATQPAVAPPTSQEARRRAKRLFARAETQYRLGHFAQALAKYQAALQFRHHPSIIFNVAQCYRQLKNTERALFFYKLFLADWERIYPGSKPPNEAEVFGHIAKLEALLRAAAARAQQPKQGRGELLLKGVPAGAQVLVDGVLRGQGPISAPIATAPGKRLVRVERAGYEPWAQTITVVAKRRVSAAVHLHVLVNLGIDTHPSAATVFVDGTNRGWTPLRLTLPAERTYALELRKPGYATMKQSITLEPKETAQASYTLEPTRELFGTRDEWFALEGAFAVGAGGTSGFAAGGIAMNIVTLKWTYLSWTILTFGGGAGSDRWYTHMETRLGVPLRFGRRGQHQVRVGLGFGTLAVSLDDVTRARLEQAWLQQKGDGGNEGDGPFLTLCLSPAAEYIYQTVGRTLVGGGFRALIPITRDVTNNGREGSPAVLLFTARIGWASVL